MSLLLDAESERVWRESVARARREVLLRRAMKRRPLKRELECVVCGGEFIAKRFDARYCSNACRQRSYRMRR